MSQFTIQFDGRQVIIRQLKQLFYKGQEDRSFRSNPEHSFLIHNLQNTPELMVNQYRRFFSTSYDIITYQKERKVFSMIQKSLFKGYWIIEDGSDFYEVYSHRTDKLSFYKNGVQVAAIPQYITVTKTVILNLDNNENINLFLGITIAFFGSYYRAISDNLFIGHIGPEKKKNDPLWRAKN